jgi:hypothetical protein
LSRRGGDIGRPFGDIAGDEAARIGQQDDRQRHPVGGQPPRDRRAHRRLSAAAPHARQFVAQVARGVLRLVGDLAAGQVAHGRHHRARADQLERKDQQREAQRGRTEDARGYFSTPSL